MELVWHLAGDTGSDWRLYWHQAAYTGNLAALEFFLSTTQQDLEPPVYAQPHDTHGTRHTAHETHTTLAAH